MNKKNRWIIPIALIVFAGLLYLGVSMTQEYGEVPKDTIEDDSTGEKEEEDANGEEENEENDFMDIDIGKTAPNFTLETLDGDLVSLEDYRGKTVLINFWATWCPYCVKEMPDLDKLHQENKEDFVVLGVNVGESKGQVRPFVEEGGYTFPILMDQDGDVARRYLIRYFPTSYMIDPEGKIRNIQIRMLTYPEMKQMLDTVKGQ